MQRKLELIRNSGKTAYAELGEIAVNGKRQPCVILAQPGKDDLVGVALAKADENGKLARIDLCIVPPPEEAIRSGEYPVAMA